MCFTVKSIIVKIYIFGIKYYICTIYIYCIINMSYVSITHIKALQLSMERMDYFITGIKMIVFCFRVLKIIFH